MLESALLWTPDEARVQASPMHRFAERLRATEDIGPGFGPLHRWSVEHVERFWQAVWQDAAWPASAQPHAVLTDWSMPALRREADGVWMPGARFNAAECVLRGGWGGAEAPRDPARPAIFAEGEQAPRRVLSFAELRDAVARCQAALRSAGVGAGDCVAAFAPNTPETLIAMLATASLGAIWSSTSPDFGFQGVLDRFGSIAPKVLFCTDGYHYGGKAHSCVAKNRQLVEALPSLVLAVQQSFMQERATELPPKGVSWEDFVDRGAVPSLEFPQFGFDHPLFIMYSSGTTGAPKGVVQGAGGALLGRHVEQRLHVGLGPEDVLFHFTTCGWIMWNWLAFGLAQGCPVVLYDGSPFHPGPLRLFALAEWAGATRFGASPKFFSTCEKAGLQPGQQHDLSTLRSIHATGSPLEAAQFHWIYAQIHKDLQLASFSGGTEILGCFIIGNPYQPVYAGQIQGPVLGLDVAAFSPEGRPLPPGQKGELVCRKPFPGMPLYFWNDPAGERYRSAYFEDFPGVWRHGDFVTITEQGGLIIHGRSDAVLNPGGVRIGSAEIYAVVEALPQVQDSLAVALPPTPGGHSEFVLFLVLQEGSQLDEALLQAIRQELRRQASPRHVPQLMLQVPEIPTTINGKKVELAVAALLRGDAVKNRASLANPQALDAIAQTWQAHLDG